MAMEYFIEELTEKGIVPHGSKPGAVEAGSRAAYIRTKTNNPVSVSARYVPVNQIEGDADDDYLEDYPITARDLFARTRLDEESPDFDAQPERVRRIYESCAAVGNKVVGEYLTGVLQFGEPAEGEKTL